MSPAAIPFEVFFDQYVHTFMCRDVSREIAAAERDPAEGGGNFVAALALLTYTEVLGEHVPDVKRGSRNRFEAFFRRLGPTYEAFVESDDPYENLRNGMVHGYLPKEACVIAMLDRGNAPSGVFRDGDHLVFVVQRYFRDFVVAASRLHTELCGSRHHLIHVWAPDLLPER